MVYLALYRCPVNFLCCPCWRGRPMTHGRCWGPQPCRWLHCCWNLPQAKGCGVDLSARSLCCLGLRPNVYPRARVLRINWRAEKCTCKGKAPCQQACSLDLNPRRKGGPERHDCTHCGDCVSTYAAYGKALGWAAKEGERV